VLEGIERNYDAYRGTATVPRIPDPGYPSVNVAKHWKPKDFDDFMTQVKRSSITAFMIRRSSHSRDAEKSQAP